jgi:hypothetical protein
MLFLPWVLVVLPSIVRELLDAMDTRVLEYRRGALLLEECHTIRIARLRPYECAEIFTHPPSYVKTAISILSDTAYNFDKCGVKCETLLTFKNAVVFVAVVWISSFSLRIRV